MLGEPLVEERVIRIQELQRATVLAENACQKQLGLFLKGGFQAFVEAREDVGIGPRICERSQVEPLPAEILDQRVRLRVRQHPRKLRLEPTWRFQLAVVRELQKGIVRHAAPQEKRE